MCGAVSDSPPSFYLHGMASNYVQDKLMLSNDFPSFDSTMSVSRPMLVCHLFTVGPRGRLKRRVGKRGGTGTSTTKSCLSYRMFHTSLENTLVSGCKLFNNEVVLTIRKA
jgi:hypothetical protein